MREADAQQILAILRAAESWPDAVAKALEVARPFVEHCYDETDREEAADAKHVLDMVDDALSVLSAIRARAASPSPPFDEAAERKAFEEWYPYRSDVGHGKFHRSSDGEYSWMATKNMWSAWLASAKRRGA